MFSTGPALPKVTKVSIIVHCGKEVFNLLEECCEMCCIQRYSAVELVLSVIFLNK